MRLVLYPGAVSTTRRSGPLGRLTQRLAADHAEPEPAVERGRRRSVRPPPAPPPGAVSFLSSVLDLRGSVDVARALGAPVPDATPRERAAEADALRARMRERIAAVARGVAATRVASLPGVPSYSPASILAALRVAGALEEVDARTVGRASRALWSPVSTAIARRAARAQADIDAVFTEEAGALAALGGRAAYVIALDALLDRVTDASFAALLDRPAELLSDRFTRKLYDALEAVPAEALERDVATWNAPGGFVAEQLSRADAFLRGLVEHRVRRALALVEACCAVEEV